MTWTVPSGSLMVTRFFSVGFGGGGGNSGATGATGGGGGNSLMNCLLFGQGRFPCAGRTYS